MTEFSVRAFSPWQCPPHDAPPRPVRKHGGGRDMSATARLAAGHWFRLAHEARIAAHAARVAAELSRQGGILMLVQGALVFEGGRFRVRLAGGRRSPDPEEFRRLYLGGVKMVLICRRLGFSRECLRQLRGRLGLPPRGPCGLPHHQVLWADRRGAG